MTALLTQPEPVILADATRDRLRRAIESGQIFTPRRYQADRLASTSRFNLDNWSRQTGKSQTNAQDAVHLSGDTNESVMYLSASLDLTKEAMQKVAVYAEVIAGISGEIQRALMAGELDEALYTDDHGIKITQTVITLPWGSRVIGRPANPRTARGFSMHVKLDEFAMHKDQDEIWAAAFPSITSRRHLRMDVMSTPGLRSDDKFADLCRAAITGETDFAYRKVTIHDAIQQGYEADAEEIRRNLRDEQKFRREYLCEFVDEAGALIPMALIRACEHEGLTRDLPWAATTWDESLLGWNPAAGDLYLGIDIGRRHDLTCMWLDQMVGDVAWTRAVIELRNVPFAEQLALASFIFTRLPIRRACVDETGIGMMFTEEFQRKFGSTRIEGVTFTAQVKAAMAEPVRAQFEDKLARIPIAVEIREDLHSIRKTVTAAGNVRYLAERTPDGHADRFWAKALAVHASNSGINYGAIRI